MGSFGNCRPAAYLKMVLVLAKLRMGPRTMSIPRSSEALSWREAAWICIPARGCTQGSGTPHHHPIPSYLQHHGTKLPLPVELLGTGEDGRGLTRTGRTVEKKMGQPILADEPLNWSRDNGVGGCPVPPGWCCKGGGGYSPVLRISR